MPDVNGSIFYTWNNTYLIRLSLSNGTTQTLALPERSRDLTITPDGSKILYLQQINNNNDSRPTYDLIIANGDLSNPQKIVQLPENHRISQAAFSPDGTKLAFMIFPIAVAPTYGLTPLWIADLENLTAQQITSDGSTYTFDWSNDSRRIAFLRLNDNEIDLVHGTFTSTLSIFEQDRGETTLLIGHSNYVHWLNNGQILYEDSDANGRHPLLLDPQTNLASSTAWMTNTSEIMALAPNKEALAIVDEENITILDSTRQQAEIIPFKQDSTKSYSMFSCWFPDSRHLIFSVKHKQGGTQYYLYTRGEQQPILIYEKLDFYSSDILACTQ